MKNVFLAGVLTFLMFAGVANGQNDDHASDSYDVYVVPHPLPNVQVRVFTPDLYGAACLNGQCGITALQGWSSIVGYTPMNSRYNVRINQTPRRFNFRVRSR